VLFEAGAGEDVVEDCCRLVEMPLVVDVDEVELVVCDRLVVVVGVEVADRDKVRFDDVCDLLLVAGDVKPFEPPEVGGWVELVVVGTIVTLLMKIAG
jgi:hypothetical protein